MFAGVQGRVARAMIHCLRTRERNMRESRAVKMILDCCMSVNAEARDARVSNREGARGTCDPTYSVRTARMPWYCLVYGLSRDTKAKTPCRVDWDWHAEKASTAVSSFDLYLKQGCGAARRRREDS